MHLSLRVLAAVVILGLTSASYAQSAHADADWNDTAIAWRSYEDGLKEAKDKARPICLVFYTDWCPHCRNYSGVFHDEQVVAEAKGFVMIRLDGDRDKELSAKYTVDGRYVPRTYFLSSDGELDPSIHAPREKYLYFYDEKDPRSLLQGMAEAKKKLE